MIDKTVWKLAYKDLCFFDIIRQFRLNIRYVLFLNDTPNNVTWPNENSWKTSSKQKNRSHCITCSRSNYVYKLTGLTHYWWYIVWFPNIVSKITYFISLKGQSEAPIDIIHKKARGLVFFDISKLYFKSFDFWSI